MADLPQTCATIAAVIRGDYKSFRRFIAEDDTTVDIATDSGCLVSRWRQARPLRQARVTTFLVRVDGMLQEGGERIWSPAIPRYREGRSCYDQGAGGPG